MAHFTRRYEESDLSGSGEEEVSEEEDASDAASEVEAGKCYKAIPAT